MYVYQVLVLIARAVFLLQLGPTDRHTYKLTDATDHTVPTARLPPASVTTARDVRPIRTGCDRARDLGVSRVDRNGSTVRRRRRCKYTQHNANSSDVNKD